MTRAAAEPLQVRDCSPQTDQFLLDVKRGLRAAPRWIPCKYFYDETGSRLFDEICELDEYYPTRTELAIMRESIDEMVEAIGGEVVLIEYGSGSSLKTRLLLERAKNPIGYVPIDISGEHLSRAAEATARAYPDLNIAPVCADYTDDYELPEFEGAESRRVVYFPGSTIGNFTRERAEAFLRHIAEVCGPGGGLLIGVDLKKDAAILNRAYNDARGVTAAFNINLLARINRELGADFDLKRFRHYAFYNPPAGRVEMHLVSLEDQTVRLDGEAFFFGRGETIWTESSHKYAPEEFAALADAAGFEVRRVWIDGDRLFSVQYLTAR